MWLYPSPSLFLYFAPSIPLTLFLSRCLAAPFFHPLVLALSVLQTKAVGLLANIAANPVLSSHVVNSGTVGRLAHALTRFGDNVTVVEKACAALAVTSGEPKLLVDGGVLPLLHKVLTTHRGNASITACALAVVWAACGDNSTHPAVFAAQLPQDTADAMGSFTESTEVQVACCGVWFALSANADSVPKVRHYYRSCICALVLHIHVLFLFSLFVLLLHSTR